MLLEKEKARFVLSFILAMLVIFIVYFRFKGTMATFLSRETGQKLYVLDYDASKTNVRYKTVINDRKLAVLHQHHVDIEDTPVDLLSLCPGVLENEVIEIITKWSNSSLCLLFFIEKVEDTIVYR